MSAYFVDVPAFEDVITEGVEATSEYGFVSWVEEWEAKFAFGSGGRCDSWLWQREMRGLW